MRRPESSRQDGAGGHKHSHHPSLVESDQRQDHLMQAILLLLKEMEPSELELVRKDIDKKIQSIRSQNPRQI